MRGAWRDATSFDMAAENTEGEDRRSEERADCDIEARVELSDRLAIACRVKDLSASGFKMQVAEAIHLPDEFDLLIPIAGAFHRYRVRMVWREGDTVGGEFITPHAQ